MNNPLSEHDKELYAKFQQLIPSDSETLDFIRNHSWADPCQNLTLKPFYLLRNTWQSKVFEFDNQEINLSFHLLKIANQDFLLAVGKYVGPHNDCHGWYSINYDDTNPTAKQSLAMQTLDELSRKWYVVHEEFIEVFRSESARLEKAQPGKVPSTTSPLSSRSETKPKELKKVTAGPAVKEVTWFAITNDYASCNLQTQRISSEGGYRTDADENALCADGITPKLQVKLLGCKINGEYHVAAIQMAPSTCEKCPFTLEDLFHIYIRLFLIRGEAPERWEYSGREDIIVFEYTFSVRGKDANKYRKRRTNIPFPIIIDGHFKADHLAKYRTAADQEKNAVLSLYGVIPQETSDLMASKKSMFGDKKIVHSFESDPQDDWRGQFCIDKVSPLIQLRIRGFATDYHVLAWEQSEMIQDTIAKLCEISLYVVEGNSSTLKRTYNDGDQILQVSFPYSIGLRKDIAIHDIYPKSFSGIRIGGVDDGDAVKWETISEVEIREITPTERKYLKALFPRLFSNETESEGVRLSSSNPCNICGWVHTKDCSRWEHPHTHVVETTSKKRAKLLFDLHSGMEKDGGDTAIDNFISDGDRKAGYQAGDILGDKLQTLLYFSTKRGRGRIRKPDEKASKGRPRKIKK